MRVDLNKGHHKHNAILLLKQCFMRLGIAMLFVVAVCSATAQTAISATLTADSTHILIGDHLKVKLALKHPRGFKIAMPVVKDSVGNMDLVSTSKFDTIFEPTTETFTQTYTVSAYDSGQFHAGPVPVVFLNSSGGIDTVFSNPVIVDVNTLPVDTNRPFKAIKGPLAVPYSWKEFIPYIIAGILLILLIIAAILLYRKYKKEKPAVAARPLPKDPAHIWARKELKKLEEEKVWQKGETKLFYSRLTDTLRLYLEYRFGWLALESTTEEIQADIDNYRMKEKAKDNLLLILRTADLVKFAKQQPDPEANIKAMENAYKFIDLTEPKEEDEKKK